MGFLHRSRPNPWACAVRRRADSGACDRSFFPWKRISCLLFPDPPQESSNLTSINSAGNAIMRVDTTPQVTGNRGSVRIQTQFAFTGGIVIMDSVHMPTGCGTWPAFWTVGPNWPANGEIDIVEGVNDYTNNQATLHTNVGCSLPNNVTMLDISGSLVSGTNCAALQTGNEGCGVRANQTNSFGAAFNNIGGGVYASEFFCASLTLQRALLGVAWMLIWGHRQCFGTTRVSPSGSSPGKTSRPISPPLRRSPQTGGRPARSGLRTRAIRSRSSRTSRRSSTPLCAATGRALCGPRRAFPVRIRVARSEPGSPPANNLCSRTARHFPRPVSSSSFPQVSLHHV